MIEGHHHDHKLLRLPTKSPGQKIPKGERTFSYFDAEKAFLVSHVKLAIINASKIFGYEIPDQLAKIIIDSVKHSYSPNKSARAWFNMVLFRRELLDAIKNKKENESITREAGIWQYKLLFSPDTQKLSNEEKVKEEIMKAFILTSRLNNNGLKKLYDESDKKFKFSFEDRLEPENIDIWLNYVNSNKTKNGNDYKEWGVELVAQKTGVFKLNDEVVYKKKEVPDDQLIPFEVVSETQADWISKKTNHYEDLVEKKLVAKVILIKNEDGKIVEIRILNSHVYSDEKHGRRLLKQIAEQLNISDEDLIEPEDGTEVLRRFYNGRDIEGHYKVSPEEVELIKKSRTSFPQDKMNFSVIQLLSHLALSPSQSGYECVEAIKRGSGLQVALIREAPQLNLLKELLTKLDFNEYIYSQILTVFNTEEIFKQLDKELEDLLKYSNMEIENGGYGISTAALLDTYVPNITQTALKYLAPDAYDLVSGGTIQHSSVSFKNFNLSPSFITALSNLQSEVLATSQTDKGSFISLRHRASTDEITQAKEMLKIKEDFPDFLREKNIPPSDKNVDIMLQAIHIDRMKDLRLMTAMTSYVIALTNIKANHLPSGEIIKLNMQLESAVREINLAYIPKNSVDSILNQLET